jgi:peptidoglycan/LPS O-acetylase OafA/YrhL
LEDTSQQIERYPSLTGLRLVAAIAVVISHTTVLMVKLPHGESVFTKNFAAVGMSLFFVLSGFVICTNYKASVSTLIGLWNFLVARFARLYPLYVVFLCADLLMKLGFHQLRTERIEALPFYFTLTQSWFYLPIDGNSLIFQFGLVPQITWSISTEWFFYLCFPLICVFFSTLRTSRHIICAIVALCIASCAAVTAINYYADVVQDVAVGRYGKVAETTPDEFYRWISYFSPYVRILEFMLGVLIANLVRVLPSPTILEQRSGAGLTLVAMVGVAVLYWAFFLTSNMPSLFFGLHMNFGFAPLLALIIFGCARYDSSIARGLSHPRVILIGETSYSIYLAHMVVLDSFRFEVPVITDPQIWIVVVLQATIAFAAIIGLALILWSVIEVPSRRAIRNALSISRAPTSARELTATSSKHECQSVS